MCGRFAVAPSILELMEEFDLSTGDTMDWAACQPLPEYNASPGMILPVVFGSSNGNLLAPVKWGLHLQTHPVPLINSRAESLSAQLENSQKLSFHRGLVPITGFYEWAQTGTGSRLTPRPYYFSLSQTPLFALGSISSWNPVHGDNPLPLSEFSIITTAANSRILPIHHRMPLIIPHDRREAWLSPATPCPEILQILQTVFPADLMSAWPVSPQVNSSDASGVQLIQPWDGGQMDLFSE